MVILINDYYCRDAHVRVCDSPTERFVIKEVNLMDGMHGQTDHKEKISDNVWQINEFSRKVDVHYNTIDRWFVRLEKNGIHYVNRVQPSDKKVYDQLDYEIALYIKEYRDKGWMLDPIFETLPNEFDLRPFPEGEEVSSTKIFDSSAAFKEMEEKIIANLKDEIVDQARLQVKQEFQQSFNELIEMKEQILKSLPEPEDKAAVREKRFVEAVTFHRVRAELEKEAAAEWAKKSENERTKRVGIFFKTEDTAKRADYIKDYVNEKYEERLKEKFDL